MAMSLLMHCCKSYPRRFIVTSTTKSSYVQSFRYLNTNIKNHGPTFKREEQKSKAVKVYLLTRFVNYIKNYDVHIKKKFPKATQAYQVFMEGVRVFYEDLKNYMKIVRIVYASPTSTSQSLAKLTRKELELYHQLPRDIFKVAPVLIASALPFSLYVILPLVYYYPRQLLTSHFWTLQQKQEFRVIILRNRLNHNRPVFRHLQLQLRNIKGLAFYHEWANILGKLGSGVQPSVEQILHCKPLFVQLPYKLSYLSGNHVRHLSKLHDTPFILRRRCLYDKAVMLIAMDRAIMREGGVHNMPSDALRYACFIRGLNPTNMKNEELIEWMNQWIKISENVDKESYSLLLHCPILLAYNLPSNWSLIYPYKG